MGDADRTFSASEDPCWSAGDTAHMGADGADSVNHFEQISGTNSVQFLLVA